MSKNSKKPTHRQTNQRTNGPTQKPYIELRYMQLNIWQNTARPWHNGTNSTSSNLNTLRHRPCVTNTRLKNITINVAPNTHSTLHIIQPGFNMSNSWATTTDRENEKTNYRTNQTDNTNNRFTKKKQGQVRRQMFELVPQLHAWLTDQPN